MSYKAPVQLRVALMVVAAACGVPLSSAASTHTVTSLADDGTPGTFRHVIASASAGDTVTFAVTGTIVLTNLLIIDKNLSVMGPGAANLTISGNSAAGVFRIFNGVVGGVSATLSGLTIANGNAAGLELAAYGGGIANWGVLTVSDTVISQNVSRYGGGGIYNGATLTVIRSHVSSNGVGPEGGGGGGILNGGTLTVIDSTISANVVDLQTGRRGGGILHNSFGSTTVTNSTIFGNIAGWGAGVFQYGGPVTINNSTIAGNVAHGGGGGILGYFTTANAPATLKNSLLGNNAGGNCEVWGYWSPTSQGYNLSDDFSCANFLAQPGDRNGVATGLSVDGLQLNGGPTPTVALEGTSPAADAVPDTACTDAGGNVILTDQRGTMRPQGAGCDVGAFELEPSVAGVATPVGGDVVLNPVITLPNGATANVSLTFDSVTSGGRTSVTAATTGPPPPSGFKLANPPVFYEITTTATFSGHIRVCLNWTEGQVANESKVAMFHFEFDQWVDITDTTSRDTVNNRVCGTTTSLSPFTLFDVKYSFAGFFRPVDSSPTVNAVKAGSAVPVKFSLGGSLGLNIFAPGFPKSQLMQCITGATIDTVEETVSAGASSLSYDAATGLYRYIWKTDQAWANSCRELQLKLDDGEVYTARFTLLK